MSLFLFSSFLGMHRNISLSCWWKWPCSNDGNGPLLAASVQCIISLNEFAPVPAHQPSPAPSKGQAVQPLPNWKKIEGGFGWLWGSWDLSRLDIWSNASFAWSNSSEKDIFLILLQEDSLLHLFTIPSEVWQFSHSFLYFLCLLHFSPDFPTALNIGQRLPNKSNQIRN